MKNSKTLYDMEIGTFNGVRITEVNPSWIVFDELDSPCKEEPSEGKNVRWGNNRKKVSKTTKRIRQKIANKSKRINRK